MQKINIENSNLVQFDKFKDAFDISEMSSDELTKILLDYILNKIIPKYKNRVDRETIRKIEFYTEKVSDYLINLISDEEMDIYCNKNIKDRRDGVDKSKYGSAILKVTQYILFNRARSAREVEGVDYLIGFVFNDVGKLGPKACAEFRLYIELHPLMRKYRITPP